MSQSCQQLFAETPVGGLKRAPLPDNDVAMQEPDLLVEEVFRTESRRVLAALIRVLGDFDLAEEALQEAFAAAAKEWSVNGTPADPVSWLVSAGKFRAIDLLRRDARFRQLQSELALRSDDIAAHNSRLSKQEIQDDQLRLIFTCCHPSIDPKIQVPLTLREVCGLSTEEIADAFLTAPATMAQRIVRGKAKIRIAGIPYVVPSLTDLPERLDAVLSVIYLVFNEGYNASSGQHLTRVELSGEAIRLGRLLLELLPDPEVMGLLALMLLHESRRLARVNQQGDLVLLEDQDRSVWNRSLIAEGQQLLQQAFSRREIGFYTLQAAISGVHAEAATAADTNWHRIVALYNLLLRVDSSPVIGLNRAVAIAMVDGAQAGLEIIDQILNRGELSGYYLAHSARGELLRRTGQLEMAKDAFRQALQLTRQDSEQRFLRKRLESLTRTNN